MDKIIEVSDSFWKIINDANKNREVLTEILQNISKEELTNFQKEFEEISCELRDEPFINYTVESEDGVEDISYWVVSQGKDYYTEVWNNPERIPYSVEGKSDEILFDIGLDVYFDRFNENLDVWSNE